jgi:hypothetical protein
MHRSQGIDIDRVLAWCCVLVAHLLAWWWLTRPQVAQPQPPGVESTDWMWCGSRRRGRWYRCRPLRTFCRSGFIRDSWRA